MASKATPARRRGRELSTSAGVRVELGRGALRAGEALALQLGSLVALDRAVGAPVDLYVNDLHVAEGELVALGERYGVRVVRLLSAEREGAGVSSAFVHSARSLAIARAARDAHRSDCERDAFDCETCREHAAAVAKAKLALREERA